MPVLDIFITFDVDPDYTNITFDRTKMSWRGIDEIPAVSDLLAESNIPFTFFVRLDNQIRDYYGTYLGLVHEYRSLWDQLQNAGNEFGWHPHLYEQQGKVYVPLWRSDECVPILREAWSEIQTLDFVIESVRIGEGWHSTETMCALNSFGLRIDSTAIPGRLRYDDHRSFDWATTPNRPYHPDPKDYRIPGTGNGLRILEVPMTSALIRTPYDTRPLLRYLNLTFRPPLFKSGLLEFLRTSKDERINHLVLIFHPDELLDRPTNGLHEYGWSCFKHNLETLKHCISSSDREFRFRCLRDATL